MSKGSGKVGTRSGGSIAATVAQLGGAANSTYLQTGFREESQAYWSRQFAGKSQTEANEMSTNLHTPIKIGIAPEPGGSGKHMYLIDGRHRMTAAQAAGATRIRAQVYIYGPRGGVKQTWTGNVKL